MFGIRIDSIQGCTVQSNVIHFSAILSQQISILLVLTKNLLLKTDKTAALA